MVALFFLSVALGTAMSGRLADYYDPSDETGVLPVIGLVAIAVGVVVLAVHPADQEADGRGPLTAAAILGANAGASGMMKSTRIIGTAKPTRSESAPISPVSTEPSSAPT